MKRRTSQRDALDRVFQETDHPLTVGQILERGRQSVDTLNQATVYRNLKLFTRNKLIRPVQHPVLGMLYERADQAPHCHFYCHMCRRVYALPGCPPDHPFPLPSGYRLEIHDCFLTGICPACAAGTKQS